MVTTPATISRYLVLETLKGGGRSELYKAEDINLHSFMAQRLPAESPG